MKKKIIAIVSVALFAGGLYVNQALGESREQIAYNKAVEVSCEANEMLAYNIMRVRQMEVTRDEQIQMIKDVGAVQAATDNAVEIVKRAHEQNVVDSNMVESLSEGFGAEIRKDCLSKRTGTIL